MSIDRLSAIAARIDQLRRKIGVVVTELMVTRKRGKRGFLLEPCRNARQPKTECKA
jgi:hypothetical protein